MDQPERRAPLCQKVGTHASLVHTHTQVPAHSAIQKQGTYVKKYCGTEAKPLCEICCAYVDVGALGLALLTPGSRTPRVHVCV